jgi:hypothetical protein
VLVVVLVLENPDRFAIRLTEQISCRTPVSCGRGIPMHRGRARRRFQISEFGLKRASRPATSRSGTKPGAQVHRLCARSRSSGSPRLVQGYTLHQLSVPNSSRKALHNAVPICYDFLREGQGYCLLFSRHEERRPSLHGRGWVDNKHSA